MPKKRQNLRYELNCYFNFYTQRKKELWIHRPNFSWQPFINLKSLLFQSADYGFPNKARPKFNITISSWKIQFMVLFILWYFLWNFYHTYLRLKNAFSVRPVQAVAMAMTKVVIPKVEWIGTRAARKDAVADSQHNKSKKLKKPTINWKKGNILASVRLKSFFLDGSKIS